MKLRTLCILLALVMAVSLVVVSCGGSDDGGKSGNTTSNGGNTSNPAVTSDAENTSNGGDPVEVSEEGPKEFVPGLDSAGVDFSGKTLKVLCQYNKNTNYEISQIIGYYRPNGDEELEDDPVKTAIQDRNNQIFDKYGISIEAEAVSGYDDFVKRVKNDFLEDTHDYQAFVGGANFLAPLTVEGYARDFYSLGENSYLRLDEDWWDPITQSQMSVGGCLFMINGDILITDDEHTKCMFFNKDIANDYEGTNAAFETPLYDLVRSGEWTMDVMYEMMKVVSVDGDNGKMDYDGEDTWGLVGVSFDTYMIIMGGGVPQVKKDADDLPVFAMADELNKNVFLKVFDIVSDRDRTLFVEDYFSWNDPQGSVVRGHFYKGKALFMTGSICDINGDSLRNAEIHYGILPMPKYSTIQDNYASTVNPYHFGILCIPSFVSDSDIPFVTYTLEAMAYLSKQDVTREYYDRTLKLKRFADDDDSADVLDIVFRNRQVDISVIFNWDDCIQYYNRLRSGKNNGIESFCQAERDGFEAAMEETIQNFQNMNG